MTKNIKILDDYLKAYEKQKQAQAILDQAKENAIAYMEESALDKIEYKNKLFSLCENKTFSYSQLALEMSEAYTTQKRIEELTGEAKLESTTNYIRLTDKSNKKEETKSANK